MLVFNLNRKNTYRNNSLYCYTVQLFQGLVPFVGPASIQFSNGEDWQRCQRNLYPTLKGQDLKSYFSHFVAIAKVSVY